VKTGKYDLMGVIRHDEGLGFGHYHSLVKDRGELYAMSDSWVRKVNGNRGSHISDHTAMILFYQAREE
jgi:ubiquitin C-terminal hydrolase